VGRSIPVLTVDKQRTIPCNMTQGAICVARRSMTLPYDHQPHAGSPNNRWTAAVGERYRLELLLGEGGMGAVYRAYDRLTDQQVALKLVPMGPESQQPADGNAASLDRAKTQAVAEEPVVIAKRASDAAARTSSLAATMAGELQTQQFGRPSRVHVAAATPARGGAMNPVWARMALAQEFRTLAALRHPHIISVLDYGFVEQSQPFFTMELLENACTLSKASQGLPLEQKAVLLVQLLRALSYLHRHGILHRDLKPANITTVEKRCETSRPRVRKGGKSNRLSLPPEENH
jgi:serine/threonine protein kinase